MGFFSFLSNDRITRKQLLDELTEIRGTLNNNWDMKGHVFGTDQLAGVTMNQKTALTLSAVYLALNILGDTLSIPWEVKKETVSGKMPVTEKDKYQFQVDKLLSQSPNKLQNTSEWFKLMEFTRATRGNAVSYIVRNKMGYPTALRFVPWENVELEFDGVQLWYTLRNEEGGIIVKEAPYWDVIHVKGLSKDGLIGMSPIDLAKESLSFGKATQQTGNKFFAEGMTSKVVLSHPGVLGEKGQKNLSESFEKEMKSKNNIVLEEGLKPYVLSVTPEQAQFLMSREFSVTEVSRWFNLPKFMLANDDPTYSNIQNFDNFFVTHNVRPRVRMYEQEFNWKLLGNKKGFSTEANMNALLRADILTRFKVYEIGIRNRIYSANEIRLKENETTYEGGDEYENPNVLSKQDQKTDEKDSD